MKRRLLTAATLLLLSLLLCGCGDGGGLYANYRALEELEPVGTLGLDRMLGGLCLTAAADRGGDAEPVLLRRSAPDLRQGLAALQDVAGDRRLFFAHTRYFILGEDYAADGIGALLDYVERDVNTRMGTEVFVLRDGRASELLTECDAPTALLASVSRDTALDGSSHVSDVRSIAVALSEYGAAAVCALGREATAGSVFSSEQPLTAAAAGYAILKDGALAGYIDGTEAEALGFLAGYPGTVTRHLSDGHGAAVTVELLRVGTPSLRFTQTEDGYLLQAELKLNAVISAMEPASGQTSMPDTAALCRRISDAVQEDALAVLSRSDALHADFLALGGIFRTAFGRPDADFFGKTEFHVEVEVEMDHSYDMSAPVGTAGGGV